MFGTFYRCNSRRRLKEALADNGFQAVVYTHGAEPAYLGFSAVAYAAGVAWASKAPSALQSTHFVFARRVGKPNSLDDRSQSIEPAFAGEDGMNQMDAQAQ